MELKKKGLSGKSRLLLMLFAYTLMFALVSAISYATMTSINLNMTWLTSNYTYNSSGIHGTNDIQLVLNATVLWMDPVNITNVTFYFVSGANTTMFVNSTINGSRDMGGETQYNGSFTYNISLSQLSEGTYTVIAEARNVSDITEPSSSINSSPMIFVIDRYGSAAILNSPNNGETMIPENNLITFFYTPTDSNLGNISLYVDDTETTKATSDNRNPNASVNDVNRISSDFSTSGEKTWYIRTTDLAGNTADSSSRTINVITASEGGMPITDSKGGVISGLALAGKPIVGEAGTWFQSNLIWVVLIGVVLFVVAKRQKWI